MLRIQDNTDSEDSNIKWNVRCISDIDSLGVYHTRTVEGKSRKGVVLITWLSGMNERIKAISGNTRNTQIHKTSGSVEVGKGLQETVTDGEQKNKL